jgi:hypothetical protein
MTVTEKTAAPVHEFMNDPIGFFGQSYTRMHSIPRPDLEALQRRAMGIRFREHYRSIEMLRKVADRLGATSLDEFNDVVPLLFSHTAFKSYPAALSVAVAMPQDAIEPIRRMCKWIVDEECDPGVVIPLWQLAPA